MLYYFDNTGLLIFKILPMLMKHRILFIGNTVEMGGGDINCLPLLRLYIVIQPKLEKCKG